jgi:hypothetical protein
VGYDRNSGARCAVKTEEREATRRVKRLVASTQPREDGESVVTRPSEGVTSPGAENC